MPEDPVRHPSADDLATAVAERVRRILAVAEQASQESAGRSRRAAEAAETEAEAYLAAARERVDAFAEGRMRRIREASDELLRGAEELASGMRDARRLTAGVDQVVDALVAAAEAVAAEAARTPIRLPRIEGGGLDALQPRPRPDASHAETASAPLTDAADAVRDIAASLPSLPRRRPPT